MAEGVGQREIQLRVSFSICSSLFYFNFRYLNQIQTPILNFKFPSAKINTNVNIISNVYYIIIYFPCHLFMEGINGFIKIFFLILCFHLKLEV
jgi:hypothetical protein